MRKNNLDPTDGNRSRSTGKVLQARFDVDVPAAKPSPYDDCKDAYWAMQLAKQDCLRFLVKYGYARTYASRGWSYADVPTGTMTVAALASDASGRCGFEITASEFAGSALLSGAYLYPTSKSSHRPVAEWALPIEPRSIPLNLQSTFDALKAQAA